MAMEISDEQEMFLYLSFYRVNCSDLLKLQEGETPFGITQEAWEN